ncbi:hypothetical protein G0U57_001400, partial [Chelydra serpentina]
TEAACKEQTIELLNYLGAQGYKVSKEKAQLVKQQVTFLGYHLCQGSRSQGKERIQVILDSPQPQTPRELRAFLGLTGFCRLWIPDYGGRAKPLYESLTKEGLLHWTWTREMEKAFRELKGLGSASRSSPPRPMELAPLMTVLKSCNRKPNPTLISRTCLGPTLKLKGTLTGPVM